MLVNELNTTDLTADPARASAIGGLLNLLIAAGDVPDGQLDAFDSAVYEQSLAHFRHASHEAEREEWLRTLYHIVGSEELFYNVIDDEEYERLESLREAIVAKWDDEVSTLIGEEEENPWASLSLGDRLQRLQWFYHTDIMALTHGDDRLAVCLFDKAERCFHQCREELFSALRTSCSTFLFPLYYQVLCLACPGKRNIDYVAYYKQFFNIFACTDFADDTARWQAEEIATHYRLSAMHRADRSVQPRLAVLDEMASAAYRFKCYQWWMGLDPDDEHTTRDYREQMSVCCKANKRIDAWLDAKRDNGVAIPPEKEAEALLTRLASANLLTVDGEFYDRVIDRSYELLPLLSDDTRLKTYLMAHLAWYCDDTQLMQQVKATVAQWDKNGLSTDDRFVLAILHEYLSAEAA